MDENTEKDIVDADTDDMSGPSIVEADGGELGFSEEPKPDLPKPSPESRVNTELSKSPVSSIGEEEPTAEKIQSAMLSILNVSMSELDKLTELYPKLDSSSGDQGRAWLAALVQGMEHLVQGNSLSDSVNRADSFWKQTVNFNGDNLGPAKPKFSSKGGSVISGERAIMKATTVLGLGAVVQIPLWHTGIWVNIKAPSESSLLELERRIANEKISLGRASSGMIFSNSSVYTVSYVVNFVLNHIYDASVKNITQDALKEMIDIRDIPLLVWGMACSIYPNGYNYARPCTANPSECQHVVSGKINLAKMFWIDNNSLSVWQRQLMSRRNDKFTDDELKRYKEDHTRGGNRVVKLTEDLRIKLKVPNIAEYELAGFTWVDNIVKLLEGSLGVSLKGQERDTYISDQGRITALRQYSHWVGEIEVGEDTITDRETIEVLLGNLSSQDEIYTAFFTEVGKYIDDSQIAIVGIPKYKCPACSGEQVGEIHTELHPDILPIDAVRTFFTLLDQRIYKALVSRQV